MKKYKEAEVKIKRREVALETSNIYTIHGLRQVGKTTEIKKKILALITDGIALPLGLKCRRRNSLDGT